MLLADTASVARQRRVEAETLAAGANSQTPYRRVTVAPATINWVVSLGTNTLFQDVVACFRA